MTSIPIQGNNMSSPSTSISTSSPSSFSNTLIVDTQSPIGSSHLLQNLSNSSTPVSSSPVTTSGLSSPSSSINVTTTSSPSTPVRTRSTRKRIHLNLPPTSSSPDGNHSPLANQMLSDLLHSLSPKEKDFHIRKSSHGRHASTSSVSNLISSSSSRTGTSSLSTNITTSSTSPPTGSSSLSTTTATFHRRKETLGPSHEDKDKVGDYVIEKTIGEGGFAKVKLATHILTDQKVRINRFFFIFSHFFLVLRWDIIILCKVISFSKNIIMMYIKIKIGKTRLLSNV